MSRDALTTAGSDFSLEGSEGFLLLQVVPSKMGLFSLQRSGDVMGERVLWEKKKKI